MGSLPNQTATATTWLELTLHLPHLFTLSMVAISLNRRPSSFLARQPCTIKMQHGRQVVKWSCIPTMLPPKKQLIYAESVSIVTRRNLRAGEEVHSILAKLYVHNLVFPRFYLMDFRHQVCNRCGLYERTHLRPRPSGIGGELRKAPPKMSQPIIASSTPYTLSPVVSRVGRAKKATSVRGVEASQ